MKLFAALLVALAVSAAPAAAGPEGQMTWGVHTTLVPTYFDPAETIIGTSYMMLYALHDALVKPMPGKNLAPSLAESWTASPDGLVYDFVLRKGARFHNGEPVTAEDAKFSFERYRGIFAKTLKERVAALETPDPLRFRIRLKQPWPDFMIYYGMFAPMYELAFVNGVAGRVEESGLGLIAGFAFSAPYEDVKLKAR